MIQEKSSAKEYVWRDRKHWLWFPFSFTKYYLDRERIHIESGLFKTTTDETLLYRIIDLRLIRTLGQKICGTGTIVLATRGDMEPDVILKNIKNPKKVKDYLSHVIEQSRSRKKVVGNEIYSGRRYEGSDPGYDSFDADGYDGDDFD